MTVWSRLKVFCLNSLTVAWSYCLAFVGLVMQCLDTLADAFGDPGLKDQIGAAIGDARITGRVLLGISVVTVIVRVRSLRKGK